MNKSTAALAVVVVIAFFAMAVVPHVTSSDRDVNGMIVSDLIDK